MNADFLFLVGAAAIVVGVLAVESFLLLKAWRSYLKSANLRFQFSLVELLCLPACLLATVQLVSYLLNDPEIALDGLWVVTVISMLMCWCELIGAGALLLRARAQGRSPALCATWMICGSGLGAMQFFIFIVLLSLFIA